MKKMKRLRGALPLFVFAVAAHAATITYTTPTSATTSGPVSASATFVTSTGQVNITLTDLLANPTDVAQLISDLDFVLSNGATTGTLTASSGQQITVSSTGTATTGTTGSTGWGLNTNVSGGLQLDALGFIGPAGLILGPPGANGKYSNANSSIAGNGPHNPFLNQTATFTVSNSTITSATTISSATFSFGTTAGVNVTGVTDGGGGGGQATPEPVTSALVGGGLIGIYFIRRRKLGSR